ncbi:MAG: glutamate-5-semialdehyde dehydrogenase [Deltaproteobacteria bacterium]|nr:glutamate-5-semialdehyde dehydrogenase [Deltaproteobacteria bacterium]
MPLGIKQKLVAARESAQKLRSASTDTKNAVLREAAQLLLSKAPEILRANAEDLAALRADATTAFRDRLALDPTRLAHMAESLRQVAALPDPVGEEVERRALANGVLTRRVRAPLGVILMVFESRPNVAVEAWSLAFKSGNVIILRGGKESMRTTAALYDVIGAALDSRGVPRETLWGITDPDRKLTELLLEQDKYVDIVVPRGGDALIEFVVENARMPIIKNDRGLCHVYVHEDADQAMALEIVANAKCQRPGVCNAMETLLVHRKVASTFLPALYKRISGGASGSNVEWFVDEAAAKALGAQANVHGVKPESFDTEYLELKMNAAVVGSLDEAIAHIERHGSRHSEAIVTGNEKTAREFQSRVVGLRELTSARWIIDGTGQVRE